MNCRGSRQQPLQIRKHIRWQVSDDRADTDRFDEVSVEGGVPDDPYIFPAPVDAGSSFIAVVRGDGVRVTATAVPSMQNMYWQFTT